MLLWSASIVVPDLPACCLIFSRPLCPAFPFRCALFAQRLRSVRLVSRFFVRRSFSVAVSSVASPVSYPHFCQFRSVSCCFARRSLVLPAPSTSFPAWSCYVHPVLFPRLPVFLFSLTSLSSTLDALSTCYSLSPSSSFFGNFFSAHRRLDHQVVVIWVRYNPHSTCTVERYSTLIN